jgi:hypothetical protein
VLVLHDRGPHRSARSASFPLHNYARGRMSQRGPKKSLTYQHEGREGKPL